MSEETEIPKPYPKTAADWWVLFDASRSDLRRLVARYLPIGAKSSPEVEITAPGSEAHCEVVREEMAGQYSLADFDIAAERREGDRLLDILSATWFGMPESTAVHREPGFFPLCDLCSEGSVLAGTEPAATS